MPTRIERESSVHDRAAAHRVSIRALRVGARMRREDDRLPAEFRQVLRKFEGAQNPATADQGREVKRDHQRVR
jgi:hypothetical protein